VTVVVDADVLIGALDASDPHHRAARSLFTSWHRSGTAVLVSAVNLSEVLVAPAADRQRLRRARTAIATLGVAVHGPGEAIAVEAARLRQVHPISLPDAYCLATAGFLDAALASFDEKVTRAARAEGTATASRRRS
jgi:predicted nucleic acid-binding protein